MVVCAVAQSHRTLCRCFGQHEFLWRSSSLEDAAAVLPCTAQLVYLHLGMVVSSLTRRRRVDSVLELGTTLWLWLDMLRDVVLHLYNLVVMVVNSIGKV